MLLFSLLFSFPRLAPPPHKPTTAIGIHGFVTLFIVDKMDGNFKAHIDTYIVKYIPSQAKPLLEKIEAKIN